MVEHKHTRYTSVQNVWQCFCYDSTWHAVGSVCRGKLKKLALLSLCTMILDCLQVMDVLQEAYHSHTYPVLLCSSFCNFFWPSLYSSLSQSAHGSGLICKLMCKTRNLNLFMTIPTYTHTYKHNLRLTLHQCLLHPHDCVPCVKAFGYMIDHSPLLDEYTPMYMVCVTFIESGISQ